MGAQPGARLPRDRAAARMQPAADEARAVVAAGGSCVDVGRLPLAVCRLPFAVCSLRFAVCGLYPVLGTRYSVLGTRYFSQKQIGRTEVRPFVLSATRSSC